MATLRDAASVTRVDTDVQAQIATSLDDYDIVVAEAAKATKLEKELTPWQTFKTHKRAAMWSIVVSSCIIMEGWDCMLYGNFFSQPAFRARFGTLGSSGTYQIPAPWQAGLSNGSNVGQLLGLWMTGIACDRWGYRKTIAASLAAVTAFIFIPVFAQSLPVLLIGQILSKSSRPFPPSSSLARLRPLASCYRSGRSARRFPDFDHRLRRGSLPGRSSTISHCVSHLFNFNRFQVF